MAKHDMVAVNYGMKNEEIRPGYARVSMKVTKNMLNAVKIVHGGAIFSLADYAFALASNSHGQVAVAMSCQISYVSPAQEGDLLIAEAKEVSRGKRTGLYQVEVRRNAEALVALFTGHVFLREDRVEDWIEKSS